jgi:hypothetical protein
MSYHISTQPASFCLLLTIDNKTGAIRQMAAGRAHEPLESGE